MSEQRPGDLVPHQREIEAVIDQRLAGAPSAPGENNLRVIDLGTVDIVNLLYGPQTLYIPTAPIWVVKVAVDRASLVIPDSSHAIAVVQDSYPFVTDSDTPLFFVQQSNSLRLSALAHPASEPTSWAQDKSIVAGINTGYNGIFINAGLGPWQAGATYAEAGKCILESGCIWSSSVGMTGGSKPDFAGSPSYGSSVDDNTVTWLNEGAIPTIGSAHFYALVFEVPEA